MKKKIILSVMLLVMVIVACVALVGCDNSIKETRTAHITFNYVITTQFTRGDLYIIGSLLEKPEKPIYSNKVFNAGYYGTPETGVTDFDVPIDNPRMGESFDANKNYRFVAWYTEPEYLYQWNFSEDRIYRDMTLYAKWVEL